MPLTAYKSPGYRMKSCAADQIKCFLWTCQEHVRMSCLPEAVKQEGEVVVVVQAVYGHLFTHVGERERSYGKREHVALID